MRMASMELVLTNLAPWTSISRIHLFPASATVFYLFLYNILWLERREDRRGLKANFDGFVCSSNGEAGFMDSVALALGVNVVAVVMGMLTLAWPCGVCFATVWVTNMHGLHGTLESPRAYLTNRESVWNISVRYMLGWTETTWVHLGGAVETPAFLGSNSSSWCLSSSWSSFPAR